MNVSKIGLVSCLLLFFMSCVDLQKGETFEHIAPGTWRGVFIVQNEKVPVNFEVLNTDNQQTPVIRFRNGEQELKSDSIRFWGDTTYIYFDEENSYLRLIYEVNLMEGHWYDKAQSTYPIRFQAQNAQTHRFPDVRTPPVQNLTGTWDIKAVTERDSTINTQLRIATDENYATAKLILKNGTTIPLEGTVQGDKVYLSGFDGEYVCMFYATVADKQSLYQGALIINNDRMVCTGQAMAGVE